MSQTIIDSHIHFWNPGYLRYPWLESVPKINRPFLPPNLIEAARQEDLQGIVFVEADCIPDHNVAEAEWVTRLAEEEPRICGIVAAASLEEGAAVRPQLEALARLPLVKGIRRLIQSEEAGFATQPDFIEGVQLLPDYGFSFDICIRRHQMSEIIQLVEQCPDVQFILDHFGKPDVRNNLMDPWREELQTLAEFPNVYCKISGLATEADFDNWTHAQLQAYIRHAVETFGPNRIVYGGDWPVSLQAIQWQTWVDLIKETIREQYGQEADSILNRLFVENSRKFYRLTL